MHNNGNWGSGGYQFESGGGTWKELEGRDLGGAKERKGIGQVNAIIF